MDDTDFTDRKGLACCRLLNGYSKFNMSIWQRRANNSGVVSQSMPRPLSVALTLLVVSVFINYVDRGNLLIAAPLLSYDLCISAGQLGILLSAFFWTYTLLLF